MSLHAIDYVILAVYLVVIAAIGLRMSRRQRSTQAYFIANRSIPVWAVAFTLMATLIGTGTVVGHPATVFQKGMILLLGNLTLPLVLIFVALFIVPFYRRVVGVSAYEYIGKRFGLGGRMYASFGFLSDRVFDLGVTLVTTAIPLKFITGWDLTWVICAVGLFTALYTMIGGIEAVVWTDVVQGALMIVGALAILARLLLAPEAGPPGAVAVEAFEQGRFALGSFELSWASLFDTAVTTQWLFILAYAINWGRRYVCDQHMVQRYLIARSDREASRAAIFNASLCVPIYITFMVIGACLFGYYALTGKAAPQVADNVVPYFIVHELPAGLVGLILATILAASMSSISSDLNSLSTVLTTDYFANFLPRSSDRARLMFGRLMTIATATVAGVIAFALIPDGDSASVMERAVTIAAVLSGGMLGLFFLGFLTTRATRRGCYVGIAACVLFTLWGILTAPGSRLIDLPVNFPFNPILIGVLGHVVLFVVGYLASLALGGYRPADVKSLTFRLPAKRAETATSASAAS